MTTTATVTVPYNEYQAIQEAKLQAELETAKLRQQLTSSKIEASDAALFEIARAAIEIVRFAVGNLPPESTKHWPIAALRVVASRLPLMPDAGVDDQELALTLVNFAHECDVYEKRGKVLGTR